MPSKLTLRLSDDARAGLDKVALEAGVSLTSLGEAIGLVLAERPAVLPADILALARSIDAERRRRA